MQSTPNIPNIPELTIRTNFYLIDAFEGDHPLHFFDIIPTNAYWDYTILSCFLNQLPNFVKSTNKPFSTCPNYDRFDARFVFDQIDNPKISFSVTIGHKINVIATIDFIKSYFTIKESVFSSYLRKADKLRTKAKYQNHIFYEITFTYIFNSTFSLYKHRNIIYHSQLDLSAIFYYFCNSKKKFYNNFYSMKKKYMDIYFLKSIKQK